MKNIMTIMALGASLVVGAGSALAQQIETRKVSDNFYILISDSLGANVGVHVGPDGLLLVDTMMARGDEQFDAVLADISDAQVAYVLNTHEHMDHNSGNQRFSDAGATVVYHEASPDMGLPREVRFADALSEEMAGTHVDIYTKVSHTMNDAIIHLPEQNVVFMGDTYATNWHPTFYGGGREGQLDAIDLVLGLSDENTIIVPGHGPITGVQGLTQYRNTFIDWLNHVQKLVAAEMTQDQMATDPQLRAIVDRFQREEGGPPLPDGSYRRFIQRTIETEFASSN